MTDQAERLSTSTRVGRLRPSRRPTAPMATVADLLRTGADRLRAAGSETPRLDAELLLGNASASTGPGSSPTPRPRSGSDAAGATRPPSSGGHAASRSPTSGASRNSTGSRSPSIRGPSSLDRRPSASSTLAEAEVVTRLLAAPRPTGTPPVRVADVGTGSGAIAIALAVALRRRRMLDEVRIMATDLDPEATRPRARECRRARRGRPDRVHRQPTCCQSTRERFDVLAGEPAVRAVRRDRWAADRGVVRAAPALDGGPDGLAVIGELLDRVPRVLRSDGVALLEIGSDQGEQLAAEVVSRMPGWTCEVLPDLAGLRPGWRVSSRSAPVTRRLTRARPRGSRSGCLPSTSTGRWSVHDLTLRPRTRAAIRAAVRRGVHVALATGRMLDQRPCRSRPSSASTTRSSPTRAALIREMPLAGHRLGQLSTIDRCRPTSPARSSAGRAIAASTPHLNHLERFIIPAGDPNGRRLLGLPRSACGDRPGSRALDPPTRSRRSWPSAIPPRPDGSARSGAGALRRTCRGDGQPPGVPRVPRSGGVERPVGSLAGTPSRDLARPDPGDRRPVQRLRDDRVEPVTASRCRPRRRRSRRLPATSHRRSSEEGAAQDHRGAGPGRPVGAAERGPAPARRRSDPRGHAFRTGLGSRRQAVTARVVPDDEAGRAEAAVALGHGRLVALPTDTVYGLAVALDADGGLAAPVRRQGRPLDRAIVLLLADRRQADSVGLLDAAAHVLAAAFWPGGLTLVVAQRPGAALPPELTGGAATIGIRLPAHAAPRALAAAIGPLPMSPPTAPASRPRPTPPRSSPSSGAPSISRSCSTAVGPRVASPRRWSTAATARPDPPPWRHRGRRAGRRPGRSRAGASSPRLILPFPPSSGAGGHVIGAEAGRCGTMARVACDPGRSAERRRPRDPPMTATVPTGLAWAPISDVDPELWAAMLGERRRQHDKIELIASENYVFAAVLEAQGSWLTNKYAEGLPGKRYYGGCEFVDIAERLAQERALELFPGAEHVNVQPHSGAQANMAAYFSTSSPGDRVLGHEARPGWPPDPRHGPQLQWPLLRDPRLRRQSRRRADRLRRHRAAGQRSPPEAHHRRCQRLSRGSSTSSGWPISPTRSGRSCGSTWPMSPGSSRPVSIPARSPTPTW